MPLKSKNQGCIRKASQTCFLSPPVIAQDPCLEESSKKLLANEKPSAISKVSLSNVDCLILHGRPQLIKCIILAPYDSIHRHPTGILQVLEAKEAGASGVMGIVTSILGKHAALYSSYAAQLGLDCPVEVKSCSSSACGF